MTARTAARHGRLTEARSAIADPPRTAQIVGSPCRKPHLNREPREEIRNRACFRPPRLRLAPKSGPDCAVSDGFTIALPCAKASMRQVPQKTADYGNKESAIPARQCALSPRCRTSRAVVGRAVLIPTVLVSRVDRGGRRGAPLRRSTPGVCSSRRSHGRACAHNTPPSPRGSGQSIRRGASHCKIRRFS